MRIDDCGGEFFHGFVAVRWTKGGVGVVLGF